MSAAGYLPVLTATEILEQVALPGIYVDEIPGGWLIDSHRFDSAGIYTVTSLNQGIEVLEILKGYEPK